ncbi:MAG: zinc ABC transporter substrate-binding protein [Sumerlaeia bacterium]
MTCFTLRRHRVLPVAAFLRFLSLTLCLATLAVACRATQPTEPDSQASEDDDVSFVVTSNGALSDWARILLRGTPQRVSLLQARDIPPEKGPTPVQLALLKKAQAMAIWPDPSTDRLEDAWRQARPDETRLIRIEPQAAAAGEGWLDPIAAAKGVSTLAAELRTLFPADAPTITKNEAAYLLTLSGLDARIRTLLPPDMPPLVIEHACWLPFFERYGLEVKASLVPCGKADPNFAEARSFSSALEEMADGLYVGDRRTARGESEPLKLPVAAFDALEYTEAGDNSYLAAMERNALNLALASRVAVLQRAEGADEDSASN